MRWFSLSMWMMHWESLSNLWQSAPWLASRTDYMKTHSRRYHVGGVEGERDGLPGEEIIQATAGIVDGLSDTVHETGLHGVGIDDAHAQGILDCAHLPWRRMRVPT